MLDDDLSQPSAARVIHFAYMLFTEGGSGLHHTVIVDFIDNFSGLVRGEGLVPGITVVVASS